MKNKEKYSGQAIAIIMVVLVVASVIGAALYSRVITSKQISIETTDGKKALEQADSILDIFISSDLQAVQNALRGYLEDDDSPALDELDKIYTKLISITEKEIKDEEVAEADCQWMQKLSSSLASLVMIHTGGYGASLDNTDQLRMALIADVYTNIEENKVIEVGVAKPKRIYVALNDSTGGKRIAIGYTFDYVEFQHPSDNRMTDEEWKEIVYNESSLKQYHPSWYGKFFEE